MDAATPQPGDTLFAPSAARPQAAEMPGLNELYRLADAAVCGLEREEFSAILQRVGDRHNYNLPPGSIADVSQQMAFFRALQLPDLALAHACAFGREAAWQRFLALYRGPLTKAAIAIAGSATVGNDLADQLYAELYGLRGEESARRSPLTSYSGRGSFPGWLRTTLAQRHVDHLRRTRRETPLEDFDAPSTISHPEPLPAELARLGEAVGTTLQQLPAEDRFLLASYFLDRRTLHEIGRTLQVHEATISRRLKRLTGELRGRLLQTLRAGGLSHRAAEEALGTDPRDLDVNLRRVLQSSGSPPFSGRAELPDAATDALQATTEGQL